jgi:hypothetical protein
VKAKTSLKGDLTNSRSERTGRLLFVLWLGSLGACAFGWLSAATGLGPPLSFELWSLVALPAYLLTAWWARRQGRPIGGLWVLLWGTIWSRFLIRVMWALMGTRAQPLTPTFNLYAVLIPPVVTVGALIWIGQRIRAEEVSPAAL